MIFINSKPAGVYCSKNDKLEIWQSFSFKVFRWLSFSFRYLLLWQTSFMRDVMAIHSWNDLIVNTSHSKLYHLRCWNPLILRLCYMRLIIFTGIRNNEVVTRVSLCFQGRNSPQSLLLTNMPGRMKICLEINFSNKSRWCNVSFLSWWHFASVPDCTQSLNRSMTNFALVDLKTIVAVWSKG